MQLDSRLKLQFFFGFVLCRYHSTGAQVTNGSLEYSRESGTYSSISSVSTSPICSPNYQRSEAPMEGNQVCL